MSKVENGKTVSVHYVGTLDDGTEFDNSRTKGEPMSFEFGARKLIPGFENALVDMEIGETKEVHIAAAEAYGQPNPELIHEVPQNLFPEDYDFQVGTTVQMQNASGQPMLARIQEVLQETVSLNFNHPLAGKNLNFAIELINVE